jgi:hypothetical protein
MEVSTMILDDSDDSDDSDESDESDEYDESDESDESDEDYLYDYVFSKEDHWISKSQRYKYRRKYQRYSRQSWSPLRRSPNIR